MSSKDNTPGFPPGDASRVAKQILENATRDLVFTLRILGDGQILLHRYFQEMIETELEAQKVSDEEYPFLQFFVGTHASELREFVVNGISVERQVTIEDIERLTGDSDGMLRVDIWDSLLQHIETAEKNFKRNSRNLLEDVKRFSGDLKPGQPGEKSANT